MIDSLALPASGTFATTSIQPGDYLGNPATYTFHFQGNVHGVNTALDRPPGSLTATMTYTASGTTYSCTSNKLPWTTTRETQPTPQPTTPPPSGLYPGSYTVGDFGGALNLSVVPNGESIENVSANVAMTCSPGGGQPVASFAIASLALPASGTFATTSIQPGTYSGIRPRTPSISRDTCTV